MAAALLVTPLFRLSVPLLTFEVPFSGGTFVLADTVVLVDGLGFFALGFLLFVLLSRHNGQMLFSAEQTWALFG